MESRDLRLGNKILANFGKDSSNRGMITEIYKDSVKIMDLDTRKEKIFPTTECFGIELTEKVLYIDLGFEKHVVDQQFTAVNKGTIDESIKVLTDLNDKNNFYFLILPKTQDNDIRLDILDRNRKLIGSMIVRYLHEMQNIIYDTTKLIFC